MTPTTQAGATSADETVEKIARIIDQEAFELHAASVGEAIFCGSSDAEAIRTANDFYGDRMKAARERASLVISAIASPAVVPESVRRLPIADIRCTLIYLTRGLSSATADKVRNVYLPALEQAEDALADAPPSGRAAEGGWIPDEPTPEMLTAARDWSRGKYGKPIGDEAARGCWQAMLWRAPVDICALATAPAAPEPAAGGDGLAGIVKAKAKDLAPTFLDIEQRSPTPRIYMASKTAHAPRWRALRDDGLPIVSTWIDEAGKGETACFTDLWQRCVDEAATATAVIVYREAGEVLKGAFVEVGAALSMGVPVYAIGCDDFSFVHHAGVTRFENLTEALHLARTISTPTRADAGAEGRR